MVIEKRASAVGMLVSLLCLRQAVLILNHRILFISSSAFKKNPNNISNKKVLFQHIFFSSVSVSTFHMQYKTIRKLCAKFSQTGSVRDIQQGPRSWVPTIGQHCYIVLNHLRVRWKSVIPWVLKERFIFHIHVVKHYISGTLRTWFSV